jgi:tetratricopeptide (TPR) repeat protein
VINGMSKNNLVFQSFAVALVSVGLLMVSTAAIAVIPDAKYVGKQLDGTPCKGNYVTFGPFDYMQRHKNPDQLQVVEVSHFSRGVETLTKGVTTTPMGDLDYTLGAWPNHHRGLETAIRFRLLHPEPKWPFSEKYPPAECFLQRAIAFRPKDGTSHLLYGILLSKQKRYELALREFTIAAKFLPGDVIPEYNMGLTLVVLKKYTRAKKIAVKVYANGFPLPGLKNQLIAVGHWEAEPEADTAEDSILETAEGSTLEEADTTLESLVTDEPEKTVAEDAIGEGTDAGTNEASDTGEELVSTEESPYIDEAPLNDSSDEKDTAQFLQEFSSAVETKPQPSESSEAPSSPEATGG